MFTLSFVWRFVLFWSVLYRRFHCSAFNTEFVDECGRASCRQAFFTRSHAEAGRKEWTKALNSAVGSHSIYTHATDSQVGNCLLPQQKNLFILFYSDICIFDEKS